MRFISSSSGSEAGRSLQFRCIILQALDEVGLIRRPSLYRSNPCSSFQDLRSEKVSVYVEDGVLLGVAAFLAEGTHPGQRLLRHGGFKAETPGTAVELRRQPALDGEMRFRTC